MINTKTLLAATIALAGISAAGTAGAATVVQAGDAGAGATSARPLTNAAAAAFDALTGAPTIVTFETAQSVFTIANGTVTNNPTGAGNALFAYNTTVGGQYVLQSFGQNTTLTFANAITSFGVILTGVQFNTLNFSFNDGTQQSAAITNYGSGAQFFGIRNFANPITSITLNNPNDIMGLDDIRVTFASQSAVPETATWGMMIAGFGMMGAALRTRRRSTTVSFA
jgi:hypothetical protein